MAAKYRKVVRYAGAEEVEALVKNKLVSPRNTGRAWTHRNKIYVFPLDIKREEEYEPIKDFLNGYFDINYDYKIYIKAPTWISASTGVYDVEVVDSYLGKHLDQFEIDEDAYDTGPVYLVPEVRLYEYNLKDVYSIVDLKTGEVIYKKGSTKESYNSSAEINRAINSGELVSVKYDKELRLKVLTDGKFIQNRVWELNNQLYYINQVYQDYTIIDILKDKYNAIYKSPYSLSYYSNPMKDWGGDIDGGIRVADHWNFMAGLDNTIHAKTSQEVREGEFLVGKYNASKEAYDIIDGVENYKQNKAQEINKTGATVKMKKESTTIREIEATFYYDLDEHKIYYVQNLEKNWRNPDRWYVSWLNTIITDKTYPEWFTADEGFLPRFHWEMGDFLSATSKLRSTKGFYGRIYTNGRDGIIDGHDSEPIEIYEKDLPKDMSIDFLLRKIYNTFKKEFKTEVFKPELIINVVTLDGEIKEYGVVSGVVTLYSSNSTSRMESITEMKDKYKELELLKEWKSLFNGTYKAAFYANVGLHIYYDKSDIFLEKIKPLISEERYAQLLKEDNTHFGLSEIHAIISKAKENGLLKESKDDKEIEGFECAICGEWSYGWGPKKQYGHNPRPLAQEGEACDECNNLVILARLGQMNRNKPKEEHHHVRAPLGRMPNKTYASREEELEYLITYIEDMSDEERVKEFGEDWYLYLEVLYDELDRIYEFGETTKRESLSNVDGDPSLINLILVDKEMNSEYNIYDYKISLYLSNGAFVGEVINTANTLEDALQDISQNIKGKPFKGFYFAPEDEVLLSFSEYLDDKEISGFRMLLSDFFKTVEETTQAADVGLNRKVSYPQQKKTKDRSKKKRGK